MNDFSTIFLCGRFIPYRRVNLIVSNRNYEKFSRNWSAEDIRPSSVARTITEIEGIFQDIILDKEIDGSTERYSKFRHERR